MKRKILLYFLAVIMLAGPAYTLDLHISGTRLSLQADNEPLGDILQALTDQGITVHADPGINPRVSVSLNNSEIEKGLKILFRNLNHILTWKQIDTPAGPFTRLEEVYLFIPGRKDLIKTLTPKTGRVARNRHDGSLYIKNEVLIRLSNRIDLYEFKKFLQKYGLTVSGFNRVTGIIKIRLPEKSDYSGILEIINKYPDIEKAEPNYAYRMSPPLLSPGYAGESPEYNESGSRENNGMPIAVIDSGLSADYFSAPYITALYNCLDPEKPPFDSLGHGTQMAMIAGGAVNPVGTKGSDSLNPVIAIKGFDEDGFISNFDLMNGLEFALKNGARIMSLSWGSETNSGFLEQALDYAGSKGLIILGAAGNEATGKEMYPAAYDSVIGVGALDTRGKKWDKSNYGDFIKIYAPGFASLPVGYNGEPGTYAGTSISTAYAANLIAGYLSENPKATIGEALTELSASDADSK